MDLGIKGKTALVLASSRGLGQAMAVALAREGVQVAITGRNPEGLAQTVTMIEAAGGKAMALIGICPIYQPLMHTFLK